MDYINPLSYAPQSQWRKTKIFLASLLIFAFLSGLVIGWTAFHYLRLVKQAQTDIQTAYSLWQDDNFLASIDAARQARDTLARVQKLFDYKILFKFPFIGETLAAGERVVGPSLSSLDAYVDFAATVEKVKNYGGMSYEQMPNKKEAVAKNGGNGRGWQPATGKN